MQLIDPGRLLDQREDQAENPKIGVGLANIEVPATV